MGLVQLAHNTADKASTQGLTVLMALCGEQCSTNDARTDEVQQSKAAMVLVTEEFGVTSPYTMCRTRTCTG